MRIDVLTLFPEVFESPLRHGILGKAIEDKRFSVHLHNIRDWTEDKHHVTDDAPYGGGGGMVMKPDPVVKCARAVRETAREESGDAPVIYLSPQGEVLSAEIVDELAALPGMILLCGNYEGIDERAIELEVDREISIGDYVVTGGELPALVLINAVARKIPGVLGNADSAVNDSFENGLLDFPHYTRPEVFEELIVPEVLRNGNHAKIEQWRREQSLARTAERRPDLIERAELNEKDLDYLDKLEGEKLTGAEGESMTDLITLNNMDELVAVRNVLNASGIPCSIREGMTSGWNITGARMHESLPHSICVPVKDYDRALEVLRDYADQLKQSNE